MGETLAHPPQVRRGPPGSRDGDGKEGGVRCTGPLGAPRQATEHGRGGAVAGSSRAERAATGPQVAATGPLEAATGPIG
ncbi:unnamed protein product [Closterium sp. NIES-65]|nr:unnamed protein product [Closterium sp. NIES-65]